MKRKMYGKPLRNSINHLKWKAKVFKMIATEYYKERWARKGKHNVDYPYNRPTCMLPVPHIGEVRHFFDDGKMRDSRHYIATITNVIPYKKAPQKLKKMWKKERWNCYWVYAYETDYFIKASIPEYDKCPIWFVRTKTGGWFSFDTTAFWMSGMLMEAGFDFEKWKKQEEMEWGKTLEVK